MSVERVDPAAVEAAGASRDDDDAAIAGIVARLSGEWVLRGFRIITDAFGGIRAGLIGQTINTANVVPVMYGEAGRRAADSDGVLPDEARRPISIARLADTTGAPFESVRRIVRRLVDAGACVRIEGGVIVPKAFVMRRSTVEAVVAAAGYTRKFVRDLEAVGLLEAAPIGMQTTEEEDDALATRRRAVLSTEYGLRAFRLLADTYGDINSGIVAQTIVTANTAHLDTRTGEGWRYAGIDETPPDDVRKPISVSRLADTLGAPLETTRQQVQRLIEAGVCVRIDGGIIVPAAVLERPKSVRASLLNVSYVRKFVREARAVRPGLAIES